MTDYQRAFDQVQQLNRSQLTELKHFVTLTYILKRLTADDLRNLLMVINDKLDIPRDALDIEVTG
jgi:hypothetical protein